MGLLKNKSLILVYFDAIIENNIENSKTVAEKDRKQMSIHKMVMEHPFYAGLLVIII